MINKIALLASLIFISTTTLVQFSSAETIRVPLASQGGERQSLARPVAGMTGSAVLARYGEPISTSPAIGEPPISRWEYAEFFVYFEYNHVVHAVLKHRPVKQR